MHNEGGDIELDDPWWASVAIGLLHPAQVQIIETLRWIGEPLSATELAHVLGGRAGAENVGHHLQRLRNLGVAATPEGVTGQDFLTVRYQLVKAPEPYAP